jgi:hypothetical protein
MEMSAGLTEVNLTELDSVMADPKTTELSGEYVTRWSKLISTTNWEKGKIIAQWREALIGSHASVVSYSDEAWSQRVGGVSPQHVGRLRRVFERFGQQFESYQGLYWSHFLAAIDWDDAEMWLEGAKQSSWSVSQMRRSRWETLGADPKLEPQDAEMISRSDDEDFVPLAEVNEAASGGAKTDDFQSGPRYDDPDFGDADQLPSAQSSDDHDDDLAPWEDAQVTTEETISPFLGLPELPDDLAEALEQFKLAVIRHRSDSWAAISQENVLAVIDALRKFAIQQ